MSCSSFQCTSENSRLTTSFFLKQKGRRCYNRSSGGAWCLWWGFLFLHPGIDHFPSPGLQALMWQCPQPHRSPPTPLFKGCCLSGSDWCHNLPSAASQSWSSSRAGSRQQPFSFPLSSSSTSVKNLSLLLPTPSLLLVQTLLFPVCITLRPS